MHRLLEYLAVALLCATTIVLVGLQEKQAGWILFTAYVGMASLSSAFRHFYLLAFSLFALGLANIQTDTATSAVLRMAIPLLLAVLGPYLISKYIFKDGVIVFTFHHGRSWYKKEFFYIAVTLLLSYLILPYYLVSTGAYLNWHDPVNAEGALRLFIGTNALGAWDELFFICVMFSLLRRHFPLWFANIAQAICFSSFLYELGFTAWGFLAVFIFALTQGYIFAKTRSLLYVITIHLKLDLVLYLALLNAHNPAWVPIFIT